MVLGNDVMWCNYEWMNGKENEKRKNRKIFFVSIFKLTKKIFFSSFDYQSITTQILIEFIITHYTVYVCVWFILVFSVKQQNSNWIINQWMNEWMMMMMIIHVNSVNTLICYRILINPNKQEKKNVMHDMIIIIMYGWIPNVVA